MVIPAGRHEADAGHVAHYVEPDEVVIETQRVLDIRDMQVDVAHLGRRGHRQVQPVVLAQVAEQLVEVDRIAPRARIAILVVRHERAVAEAHGPVLRRLGVDLDAVAIRVPQVVGLGHDMVGGGLFPAQAAEPGDDPGQLAAVRHEDREVIEA